MQLNPAALRSIRQLNGFSLAALAEASGIHYAHLWGLEHGRHQPRPATIKKLAEALKVPIAALVRGEDVDVQAATG